MAGIKDKVSVIGMGCTKFNERWTDSREDLILEAVNEALADANLTIDDIDVFECNEAFAAQNLGVIKEMENQSGKTINQDKWNPNGGAISFGHPNGASGARIGIFCMKELARTGGRYGLFSSCCGGGQGVTTLIENLRR